MTQKIKRPAIIIASIGRTGTKFFSYSLGKIFPDSTALHEPDVLKLKKGFGVESVSNQIKTSGAINAVKNIFGKWSLVRISDDRLYKKITDSEAIKEIIKQRKKFIKKKKGKLYIESSLGYYGLTDILDRAFADFRVIYVIRNGRDWVRSTINWGEVYKNKPLKGIIGHSWPEACNIENDLYRDKWPTMTKFEKVCWLWTKLNEFALDNIKNRTNIKIVKFEDILGPGRSNKKILETINFLNITKKPVNQDEVIKLFRDKKNASTKKFGPWEDWNNEQREGFMEICGETMKKFNYL